MLRTIKKKIRKYPIIYKLALKLWAVWHGAGGVVRGKRGSSDHLKSTWSYLLGSSHIVGRPMNITIEPSTFCNVRCSVCETGSGDLGRNSQNMSYAQFRIIIDKVAPHTNTLMFYFMGESFLNKDSYAMIEYAKDRGIPFVTTCTNGDAVSPAKLVSSGLDEISFQVAGTTQKTHGAYREQSDLDRVLNNLRETVRLKRNMRSCMLVKCGFILMKHNEHEVADFKDLMKEIGVDEAIIIDPCVRTVEQAREMLPTDKAHWFYDSEALERGQLRPKISPDNECPWLYYSMTIQVSGDVVPCCRDTRGKFVMGNMLKQDLQEIWNGEKFTEFRKKIHSKQSSLSLCRLCSGYPVSRIV
jgi:radical SAM protein with 4Fe4S-binding SPASM domain